MGFKGTHPSASVSVISSASGSKHGGGSGSHRRGSSDPATEPSGGAPSKKSSPPVATKKLGQKWVRNFRRRASATRLVESAFNESGSVDLLPQGQGREEKEIKIPLDITNVEAMEAASIDIKERIREKGSITACESAEIIQEKMRILMTVWAHFPGAMSSEDVLEGYKKVVERRGYTPENTLFAQSICPDEVNHEEGDITDIFSKYCGECFHMGGLAGIPFTGKVGFGAFSHHVPDGDGHCAVLMAPHIGIDDKGRFGSYLREGQSHSGSCCGAAVGAYVHCRSGKPIPDLSVDPEFYQFNYIINRIHNRMDEIVGETECAKQASLSRFMHQIGTELLSKCVNTNFGGDKSTLVVLTGIQINMPRPFCDFFLPLDFYIMKKDGTREDVFDEAFGPKAAEQNYCRPCM